MSRMCDDCLLEYCSYEPHSEDCQSARLFKTKIGIFGGTFSPMTKAHLDIIDKSLDMVDKVVVIPTSVSYYRESKVPNFFSFDQRVNIIKSMINLLPDDKKKRVEVNEMEKEAPESWRTIDTIQCCEHIFYPGEEDREVELYLILGTDSFNKLHTWYKSEELLKSVKLIVAEGRNGEELTNPFDHIKISIDDKYKEVSASQIRLDLIEKIMYNYIEEIKK